ncbi:MAG: 16S rRNA (cytidine(1402)-2'-O)-methyltransferase [Candidatus Sericytochromatia bacterium]|nr:16S rRNA (cytidine(1402)-2'-O)-methyltransferase [Candidatus Sericytochromatia bacterium]
MEPAPVTGQLAVVATPIGNLGDITQRALDTLRTADVVAAEDTRHSGQLLHHFQIDTPMLSYHEHNAASRESELLARITAGQTVALVSDAGTPGISDPGQRLIAAARDAGLPVTVIPGPSALITALVGSGLPTDRFTFEGFLPRKGKERAERLAELQVDQRTVVFYESPQRLTDTLAELAKVQPERFAVVGRELTKRFETYYRGTLAELAAGFAATPARGECVVMLAPAAPPPPDGADALAGAVSAALAAGLGVADAARQAVRLIGVPRRVAYDLALRLQQGEPDPDDA